MLDRDLELPNLTTLLQLIYTPTLTPVDFSLFQRIKTTVKGDSFKIFETIQIAVTKSINEVLVRGKVTNKSEWIPKGSIFKILQYVSSCTAMRIGRTVVSCVASRGSYFKGGNVEL